MVGWFWPVSISEMKFRCTPDSKPSCSWLMPAPRRSWRSTRPNASCGVGKGVPDILGNFAGLATLSLPDISGNREWMPTYWSGRVRQKVTLWVFWVVVLLGPMFSGLFDTGQIESTNRLMGSVRLSLTCFGYCVLVGWVAPRVLSMMNAFEGSQESAAKRNRIWFERAVLLGLASACMVLVPVFS